MSSVNTTEKLCAKILEAVKGSTEYMVRSKEFEQIQGALSKLHAYKKKMYGEYLSEHRNDTKFKLLFRALVDVERKMTRAKNLMELLEKGEDVTEELVDTWADVSVYGILVLLLVRDTDDATGE